MPYTGHFAPTQGITPMHARAFQGVVDLLNPLAQVAAGNSVPQRIGNADYSKLITAATNIANYATENGRYEDHDAPAQLQDNYVRITEGFHRGASFDVTYHTPKRKITLAERKAPARPGRGSMKIGHSAFEVRDSRTVGKGDDTIHTRFSYDLPRPGFVRGRWINLSFSDAAIRRSTLLGNLMDTDGINLNPHSCLFIFSLLLYLQYHDADLGQDLNFEIGSTSLGKDNFSWGQLSDLLVSSTSRDLQSLLTLVPTLIHTDAGISIGETLGENQNAYVSLTDRSHKIIEDASFGEPRYPELGTIKAGIHDGKIHVGFEVGVPDFIDGAHLARFSRSPLLQFLSGVWAAHTS